MIKRFILFVTLCLSWRQSKGWTPIGSVSNFDKMNHLKIMRKDYVVWYTSEKKQFVVQDDYCPRYYTPLSEGYLNQDVLCSHHGMQFNAHGECLSSPKYYLKTYPTCQTGDILWVDFCQKNNSRSFVENHNMTEIPYVRNVCCSWNFVIEYFMDHKHFHLDSKTIHLLEMNRTKIGFFFQNANHEDLKMEFIEPYLFQLSDRVDNNWRCFVQILCVPITTGKTKIILCEDKKVSLEERIKKHSFYNQMFENFEFILHRQEVNIANRINGKQRHLDYTQKMIGKWMERYYPEWISYNQNELSRDVVINHKINHDMMCKDCCHDKNSKI